VGMALLMLRTANPATCSNLREGTRDGKALEH